MWGRPTSRGGSGRLWRWCSSRGWTSGRSASSPAGRSSAPVAVVLRAESAALHRAAGVERANALAGTIAYTVYLGTSTEYEVQLADGIRLRVIEQMPSGIPSFAEGEAVMVSWAAEDCIVLPGS